jgi:hypothetical protein
MAVERQVELRWGSDATSGDVPVGLSAVCRDGPWLWIAGDEEPQLERLGVGSPDGAWYADRRTFRLADVVDLPVGPEVEVDVEGLDRTHEYLWIVGSHSRTRKQVGDQDDAEEAFEELRKVRTHPNRHVIIRVPIADPDGDAVPVRSLAVGGTRRTAALLDGGVGGLADVLATDEHLAPFVPIPGKDNGLDVEGILALEDGVLIGLRGPVLRGWAVVLELHLEEVPGRPDRLALPSEGRPYRKHFLQLDGLGVRDLCRMDDDVLVLAGPTLDVDGPVRLYRWTGAARERGAGLVRRTQVPFLQRLPHGRGRTRGRDHPEGITLLRDDGHDAVLVVYDSPAEGRQRGDVVVADLVRLRDRRGDGGSDG